MELEVRQAILALKIACVAQARLADVNCCDPRLGLAKRVPGRLRRTATRDKDLLVAAERLGWPQEMKHRPATIGVAVQVAMLIQAGQRCRIGHPLIKVADDLRNGCSRHISW